MEQNLHSLRKSYEKDALLEDHLAKNPFEVFSNWFQDAENDKGVEEANAMAISTIGQDGFPKTRIVLLKEIEDDTFIFYTNYTSEKAVSISENPQISLHFFWPSLERQVIIKAMASKTSREKSASYFDSRPRGSQLGAWASHQSDPIASREALEKQLKEVEKRFEGQEVPLPEFWGGFQCTPLSFEFWQGRPNRLHDRILFEKSNDGWNTKRLQP
ncbi:pyridoxamine 5'-phosphate oxidase [Nonlabens agnitus]|uniref:Pyridoxine/pyridoxamine 5'-phosphate oxidase n=1 Tax=Nonlabens agnitus TaxID=870484 RepID=A0A2S9WTS6_9FLAO|nr:pyridoxamine 5'-phosphate oxidase [Nonlabens agnitus]PRP66865.1 pyridoxamine 5'-phosphate oxidase [Nonlabens agnitus]